MERIFAEDGGLFGELQGDFESLLHFGVIWLSKTVSHGWSYFLQHVGFRMFFFFMSSD